MNSLLHHYPTGTSHNHALHAHPEELNFHRRILKHVKWVEIYQPTHSSLELGYQSLHKSSSARSHYSGTFVSFTMVPSDWFM